MISRFRTPKEQADVIFAMSTKLMSECLEYLKLYLKNESFEFLNISLFADAIENKLVLMAEVVDYIDYDSFRNTLIKKEENMKTTTTPYMKITFPTAMILVNR